MSWSWKATVPSSTVVALGRVEPFELGVEHRRAGLERVAEALLLAAGDGEDGVGVAGQLGVGVAHDLDAGLDHRRQDQRVDAEHVGEVHGAAQDPAQDVAAVLVRGHDAVGDQERHGAGVVGEQAQGDVGEALGTEGPAGDLLGPVGEHRQRVGRVEAVATGEDRRGSAPGRHRCRCPCGACR